MLQKTSGKLTGSKISEIADVDITGLADGYVLKWLTNKWIVAPETVSSNQSASVSAGGGSAQSITQSATDGATASRTTLVLQNNGTGGSNEFNIISKNAAGSPTFSVTQSGFGSFSSGLSVGGNVASTSVISPTIYGSTLASGTLTLDSTNHATKGNIFLAPSGGNVGVGTTSPLTALETRSANIEIGRFVSSNADGKISVNGSGSTLGNQGVGVNAGDLYLFTGATERFRITAGGGITAGTTTQSYLNFGNTGNFIIGTSSTERLRIDSTGNVGIGTTTPAAHLEIAGNLSSAAWTTNGIRQKNTAATFTDTSSSGTVASVVVDNFARPTLAASSATTYTAAATVNIADSPAAGTNVSISTPISLGVTNSAAGSASNQTYGIYSTVTNGSQYTTAIKGYSSGNGFGIEGEIAAGTGAGVKARGPGTALLAQSWNGGNAVQADATPNSGTNFGVGVYASLSGAANVGYAGQFVNNSATGWGIYSSGTSRNYFNGSVGIGTATPSYKLHVTGGTLAVDSGGGTDTLRIRDGQVSKTLGDYFTWDTGIRLNTVGGRQIVFGGTAVNVTNDFSFVSSGKLSFYTNGYASETLHLTSTGLVGIGTNLPTEKLMVEGNITPATDNLTDLGTASLRFKNTYLVNAPTVTSDVRQKKNIKDSDLGLNFILKLRPVSYFWKTGDEFAHYGLIAQETEKVLKEEKKSKNVIVSRDEKSDTLGVRYTELISPIIKAIQDLFAQVKTLTRSIASVETKTHQLEVQNQNLVKENAELKARLDRIEKLLEKK